MDQFRRLLVGLDLDLEGNAITPGSRRAALQAQWLAERTGASVTFFHSTWSDLHEDAGTIQPGPSANGKATLEALVADYEGSGTPVELVVSAERSWMEMIRRVQRGQNDLIVVARRNQAGLTRLGSVSRKLMRKCPCPVWVVKPNAPLVHERVLVATDLRPVGDLALELGAFVARAHSCELHVVHAWQVPFQVQMAATRSGADEATRTALADLQRNAETHVRSVLARVGEGVDAHLHIGQDAPADAILEGVDRLHPDLLVMGTVSRGGVAGFLVGNTAEKLLDKLECSLLTIKPADFVSPVGLE